MKWRMTVRKESNMGRWLKLDKKSTAHTAKNGKEILMWKTESLTFNFLKTGTDHSDLQKKTTQKEQLQWDGELKQTEQQNKT